MPRLHIHPYCGSVTRIFTSRVVFPKTRQKNSGSRAPKTITQVELPVVAAVVFTRPSTFVRSLVRHPGGSHGQRRTGGPGYMHFWLNHPQLPSVVHEHLSAVRDRLLHGRNCLPFLLKIVAATSRSTCSTISLRWLLLSNAWVCLDHRAGGVILLLPRLVGHLLVPREGVLLHEMPKSSPPSPSGTFALVFCLLPAVLVSRKLSTRTGFVRPRHPASDRKPLGPTPLMLDGAPASPRVLVHADHPHDDPPSFVTRSPATFAPTMKRECQPVQDTIQQGRVQQGPPMHRNEGSGVRSF